MAVCTRERPTLLAPTLAALEREASAGLDLLLVVQGRQAAVPASAAVRVIADSGRGLSRARNLALASARTEWIAFVDDDCRVGDGFGAALVAELAASRGIDWVTGHVDGGLADGRGLPLVTTFPVAGERLRSGRWTLPGSIGFGVLFAVRCSAAQALGGWDERLGPGVADFPAADDMDFNYRFLRSGRVAKLTPAVRAVHEQWRSPEQLLALQRGYLRAWSGFAMKHLSGGDLAGGLWLWSWGVVDVLDMAASALGRRSGLRARMAAAKLVGLVEGTLRGLGRSW